MSCRVAASRDFATVYRRWYSVLSPSDARAVLLSTRDIRSHRFLSCHGEELRVLTLPYCPRHRYSRGCTTTVVTINEPPLWNMPTPGVLLRIAFWRVFGYCVSYGARAPGGLEVVASRTKRHMLSHSHRKPYVSLWC